jgi:hypothetical protein
MMMITIIVSVISAGSLLLSSIAVMIPATAVPIPISKCSLTKGYLESRFGTWNDDRHYDT